MTLKYDFRNRFSMSTSEESAAVTWNPEAETKPKTEGGDFSSNQSVESRSSDTVASDADTTAAPKSTPLNRSVKSAAVIFEGFQRKSGLSVIADTSSAERATRGGEGGAPDIRE